MACVICGEYIPEGERHVCINCQKNLDDKLADFRNTRNKLNEFLRGISIMPVIPCKHCLWYDEEKHFCTAGHIDGKILVPSDEYCSKAILK